MMRQRFLTLCIISLFNTPARTMIPRNTFIYAHNRYRAKVIALKEQVINEFFSAVKEVALLLEIDHQQQSLDEETQTLILNHHQAILNIIKIKPIPFQDVSPSGLQTLKEEIRAFSNNVENPRILELVALTCHLIDNVAIFLIHYNKENIETGEVSTIAQQAKALKTLAQKIANYPQTKALLFCHPLPNVLALEIYKYL